MPTEKTYAQILEEMRTANRSESANTIRLLKKGEAAIDCEYRHEAWKTRLQNKYLDWDEVRTNEINRAAEQDRRPRIKTADKEMSRIDREIENMDAKIRRVCYGD